MRTVMASPASPFAISEASGIGIPKAAAALPVGWRGACGGMHGEMQGKYYRYCSRSIRYSTDLNSENNKFDMETFDLVSQYCTMYDRLLDRRDYRECGLLPCSLRLLSSFPSTVRLQQISPDIS